MFASKHNDLSVSEKAMLIQQRVAVGPSEPQVVVPRKPKKARFFRLTPGETTAAVRRAIRRAPAERLPAWFEQTCDRRPNEIAVICGSAQLTYQELDRQANRLAYLLISRGVRKGSRVGILLDRSLESYVALLGVVKAGAAFVPLDPSFPPDLVAFIAQDAGLCDLVTSSAFREKTRILPSPVLEIDRQEQVLSTQPETRPDIYVDPLSQCYIIYTQDASGQPKGIAFSHANIVNFLRVATPIYRVTHSDRVYQGMSIASDLSLQEIWPTWVAGATLVMDSADSQRGHGLTEFLVEQKISVLYCTPGLVASIERDVPSLRSIIVGGEICPADLISRWSRPGRRALNTYGPAETTLVATWGELFPDRHVTLGSPLPTYQVYILDGQLCPAEDGKGGEICIGGPGVALGYLNRPDLTQDRFVPNPVLRDRQSVPRLYRTGDLGRMTVAGEIEYLGRLDSRQNTGDYRVGGKSEPAIIPGGESAPHNEDSYGQEVETARITQLKHIGFKHVYKRVMSDPLYKNALFNMSGTFVLGGLGFVFWIVVARLYNTEQVGIATTLISIMTLLSSFTILGLGSGLMRHLPKSSRKNELINSSFIIVMLVTIVASIVFLLGLPVFSNKLLFIRSNILYAILFILFVIIGSWNPLLENTFMAFRSAGTILIKDLIIGILKLMLPFALLVFGAFGIFASASIALAVGVLIGLVILIFKLKVRPSFSVNLSLTKGILKYSFANYLATFAMNMPSLVLPVIILNTLSAKYAAYYYVAFMIQTSLQIIPSAATQALLIEGSYNETELKKYVKKAIGIILVLLVPAIAIIVLGGNVVLQFFGKNYASEGLQFLRLFSISTLFTAILFIANAIINVKQRIKTLVLLNIIASALTLGLSCAFISGGLDGVGWGWTLGQAIAGAVAGLFIIKVFLHTHQKS